VEEKTPKNRQDEPVRPRDVTGTREAADERRCGQRQEEPRKPARGCPNPVKGYRREKDLEGQEESGLRPKGRADATR
jgi:hypothetical protein